MKKIISILLTLTTLTLLFSSFALTASADYYSTAFIGDSICKMGQWNEYFERDDIDNYGKGGYTSARVLEVFKGVEKTYDQIFIICGINDKKIKDWNYDISLENYKAIIDYAIEKNPNCKIYSISLLPTSGDYKNFVDEGYQAEYNKRLVALADTYENVTFINCYDALADENGYYKEGYTEDGLHPEYNGFIKIADVLRPYVNAEAEDNPIAEFDGDINGDGNVDILDVALLRAHIVGNKTLTDDEVKIADVNGDNNADIIDVALIRNYIVNKSK